MSEEAKEITVTLKPIPNELSSIKFNIKSNATVSELEEEVKNTLGNLNDVPMGILKFNGQELNDKDETLEELGIKNNSEIENENRVVLIKTLDGQKIYITCDENTTVREFLKKLKDKNPNFNYIVLMYSGESLQRSTLDQKLLGYQIGGGSIKYGDTLNLVVTSKEDKNSDTVFDLNNLEESKNSNYHPFRIIVGIADLLLLLATITTFLLFFLTSLNLSIAVPIVLTVLFFVGAALFFGLGKILPKSWTETPKFTAGNNIDKQNNSITRDERQNMPDIEENNSEKTENDL